MQLAHQISPTFHSSFPFILDNLDRVSIFHGTNFVEKKFPWYPASLTDSSHILDLKNAGFNAIRLGLFWTGAEPTEGQFNETYYDILGGIVDELAANGMYAFIDVHQDVLSTKFCLYDAFPLWAIDKSIPAKDFPWPLDWDGTNPCPYERGWSKNYFADGTGKAFESLYQNYNGLTDSFAAFWKYTANYFKDKPILGYEIINEPWAGDIYSHPDLLLPGHAGTKNLQPFYDVIASSIRSVDTNHLIFYEPVTWGMIFNGTVLGTGFDKVPGGAEWANQSVLSYHYYCWWLDTSSEFDRKTCDQLFGPKVVDQVLRDVSQIGGAAMLTEWGQGCADRLRYIDISNASTFTECTSVMATADKRFMGWTDWYFGGSLNDGPWFPNTKDSTNPLSATWKLFSRPFARYVAGKPTRMTFEDASRVFSFCYIPSLVARTAGSELFVNFDTIYPEGYTITGDSSNIVWEVNAAQHIITVREKGLANDVEVDRSRQSCVTVSPSSV